MDIMKVFAAFLCIFGICGDIEEPTAPSDVISATPPEPIPAQPVEEGETTVPAQPLPTPSPIPEEESLSPEQETKLKLNLTDISTITIQTCEDAVFLTRRKLGLGLQTILTIEQKCEEEEYFNEKIMSTLLIHEDPAVITQNDCTKIAQRLQNSIRDNEEALDDKRSDEREHEAKVRDFESEGKDDQAGRQRDDLREIRDEIEHLLAVRERLIDLDRMVERNC